MGQYWKVVNLDKREYLDQYKLGAGAKLWEQLAASGHGTGAALIILCAAMPENRGGGDLDLEQNWHGPERTGGEPGEFAGDYQEIAKRTIGRWAGDRIALVGDYAEPGDLKNPHPGDTPADLVYGLCMVHDGDCGVSGCTGQTWHFTDVAADVARVIEHELKGQFVGTPGSWLDWTAGS